MRGDRQGDEAAAATDVRHDSDTWAGADAPIADAPVLIDAGLLGARTVERRLSDRAGTDRAGAAQLQEDLYGAEDVVFGRGEPFRYRHRTLRDLHVELVSSAVTTDRSGELDGGDWLTFGWTAGGGVHVDDGFYRYTTEPGIPVVFPADRRFTVMTPAGVHHLVRIDLAFVEAVGAVLEGGAGSRAPVFLTQPSREGLQGLRSSVTAVAAAAFGEGDTVHSRLSLQVQLAEWIVRSFAATVGRHELGTGKATVELAQAYLVEHCGEHISLADLCRETGVSARTLQTAFLQHTDSTPMAYLQSMRLDRVRIALQLAEPGCLPVATVAREWGFRHMGRFAGSYLQRFGEYPGETLRGVPTRHLRS